MLTKTPTIWHGCYDDSWKGLIVDEAFAHPAKYAHGLIARIADYLDLPAGSVVVDPFGGVGLGGIIFASRGVRWIGCELEEKFVGLAEQNFAKHAALWHVSDDPFPRIVQGDSRQLREHVGPVLADCVVGSPPFAAQMNQGGSDSTQLYRKWCEQNGRNPDSANAKTQNAGKQWGSTPGQLGGMPAGSVDAVVSSPPYEGSQQVDNREQPSSAMSSTWRKLQGVITDGEHVDNLGNQQGETFWTAARDIVAECHAILKPGGLAVWVCKDFVRKGQRVPFSRDWATLCESQGFQLVEWIHASLVKETRNRGLFEDEVAERKERKSFFRRLAEKKGSPPIDHEDVLVMKSAG